MNEQVQEDTFPEELMEIEEVEDEQEFELDESDTETGNDSFYAQFDNSISESLLYLTADVDADKWSKSAKIDELLDRVIIKQLSPKESKPVIKERLKEPFKAKNKTLSKLQKTFMDHVFGYKDVFCSHLTEKEEEINRLLALHLLNHVFKTRDLVLKNNSKLKAGQQLEFRDQGFTRPKILVLLPFKNHAYDLIQLLLQISGASQVENKKRFTEEFFTEHVVDERKSEDYNKTFKGNIDDCFRIGIKFNRKQVKLYSSFYTSDIIIASPLGLKIIIDGKKKQEFDFLSSIEIVMMNHAEIFLMQNWDHVNYIFDHLNLIPNDSHGCDFSRVRTYALDGKYKYVRQTLVFSGMQFAEMNSMINSCKNISGSIKITKTYAGSISDVVVAAPLVFQRIPKTSISELANTRFQYFTSKILPTLHQSGAQKSHVLIVVPIYFDFVRIRNYLTEHNYNFASISEYTSRSSVDRSRHYFKLGETKILLYSERAHFYRRYKIPKIQHLVFYQPPTFQFFSEFTNQLENHGNCLCLYSSFDKFALERIVGSTRVPTMINGEKEAFMFSI